MDQPGRQCGGCHTAGQQASAAAQRRRQWSADGRAEAVLVGLVSADDLLEALSQEFAVLARALRKGIALEKSGKAVASVPRRTRIVYPAGSIAMQ